MPTIGASYSSGKFHGRKKMRLRTGPTHRSKYLPLFYTISRSLILRQQKPNAARQRQDLAGASARFLSGEQLVDRAEKFRLWARSFGRPLSLGTSPQPKARRLSRVATRAVLSAANPATNLLHRSSLVRSERPSDAEVWC